MKSISKSILSGVLCLAIPALVAAKYGGEGGNGKYTVTPRTESPTLLDATEASHLTFMREEEKLARDVYLQFAEWYPEQPVFSRIASRSEQTHTDTMRDILELYNIEDPNPDTNDFPDSLGVFTGEEWGWYFTEKYTQLTEAGLDSELDALYVGAFIEELDMYDIAECPQVMHDNEGIKYPDPCGLNYTEESALINAYRTLLDGSEHHLRAYVGKIESVEGYCTYGAQYLTQEEVNAILGRTCEQE